MVVLTIETTTVKIKRPPGWLVVCSVVRGAPGARPGRGAHEAQLNAPQVYRGVRLT